MKTNFRLVSTGVMTCCLVAASCAPTLPEPTPPTVNPERITIVDAGGGVRITGEAGAIEPGGETIRVTSIVQVISTLPEFLEVVTGDEGTFEVSLRGSSSDRYYIEFLLEEGDLFVKSITGGAEGSAVEITPGLDSDGDGSPDPIDCAPEDETLVGLECPEA